MASEEEIARKEEELSAHRARLAHYLIQRARLGADHEPPGVRSGIDNARTEIARCKATLRDWGVPVEELPDDVELPFASPQVIESEPSAGQPARDLQPSNTTIIGDGNVIGDGSSSQVIKSGSGIALELPADRLKYLGALQRMHAIIANLAPVLLPELQEYERSLRTLLEQDSQHFDAIRQAEWTRVAERLNALARRAGLNLSLHDLAQS